MKKRLYLITAAAFLAGLSGCYFFPEEEPLLDPPVIREEDVTYSTYAAKLKTITSRVVATGYVTPRIAEDCYFTAYTGNFKAFYVKAGDVVEAGQLIAELDTGELEYDLEIQRLRVELARLNYNSSASTENRLNLEIEQNTLEQYEARWEGARIYAASSGQVSFTERLSPGQEVNPYRIIARIVEPSDLYVKADVGFDSSDFTAGDKVEIIIGETSYEGTISRTPKTARENSEDDVGSISAEFVSAKPSFTDIGSLADVIYVKAVSENAVVIPKNLVKTLDGRTYVQVYEDGAKIELDVETGISNATEVEIISGLQPGQQVVVR